ncbi:MAG: hypothetical protein MUO89_03990 [Dehalococcoidia bacterium]|nr:hypothetical protein [Dehalococcoidia bacterium]
MSDKQDAILEAIRLEALAGKSLKEAVKAVMQSKQFNHMTVRRVVEKLEVDPTVIYNKSM